MGDREWEIGICGTFDVANYGDLLFPLIAEAELKQRLGSLTLHRFSYHAKEATSWPFDVTSLSQLPSMIHRLDGLLLGGGFIIRFDKEVAPGYGPPSPEIHHPTGYWLTPALMALQNDVPVVWNAPGTDGKSVPDWARPLMEEVLTLSRYVSVRDQASRAGLEHLTDASIAVVPDTAFGVPRLLALHGTPSSEVSNLSKAHGLDSPYVVVQAKRGMEGFVQFIKNHVERLKKFRFLVLPIGPVLGDDVELIDPDVPGIVRLPSWPNPVVLAELISRAEAVAGHSYHLCVTALASGVPVFARHGLPQCKYSALQSFHNYFVLPENGEPELEWFLARVGRSETSAAARAACVALNSHWDRISMELRREPGSTARGLNRLWQFLPFMLEDATTEDLARKNELRDRVSQLTAVHAELTLARQHAEASRAELDQVKQQLIALRSELDAARQQGREQQSSLERVTRGLSVARAGMADRDARIAEISDSLSWKVTAPLRFAGRYVSNRRHRHILNFASIRHHRLETDPYAWAAIGSLFTPQDAESLAATYPCDHFKVVARSDVQRFYEYEARALIGMGKDEISNLDELSDAWRKLARDILSAEYREAMTILTGCDLMNAPVEVNVFHYGPGASLDAHPDLPDKLVTHVLYFNRSWNGADGGCLRILRSADPSDMIAEIPPLLGQSSVIVRSENSWHAVSRVANDTSVSRRSMTVTFYRPGSVSTMWPPGDDTSLHRYRAADLT